MLIANQQEMYLGDNLKFGVPYNFKYTLTNKYSKPVNIMGLQLGCKSCTKAWTDTEIVAPGKSTDINVQFTPGSTGPALKSLSVEYTVDGDLKIPMKLTFRGIVK